MEHQCPECSHKFFVPTFGAAAGFIDNAGSKFGALIGAIAGATASRRVGGAVVGTLVGWGLGRWLAKRPHCPVCEAQLESQEV